MVKWRRNHTENIVEPMFKARCAFCGGMMKYAGTDVLMPFATDLSQSDKKEAFALDTHLMCPKCFFIETFGVAVDEEFHRKASDANR